MIKSWEAAMIHCESTFGVQVDTEEEFFICVECGEPIYKEDWADYDDWTCCPICEESWLD